MLVLLFLQALWDRGCGKNLCRGRNAGTSISDILVKVISIRLQALADELATQVAEKVFDLAGGVGGPPTL